MYSLVCIRNYKDPKIQLFLFFRGIIMTVFRWLSYSPWQSHSSLMDHFRCIMCITSSKVQRSHEIHYNVFHVSFSPSKCGKNFSATISKPIHSSCEMRKLRLSSSFILSLHVKWSYKLTSMGVLFPHFISETQQSSL